MSSTTLATPPRPRHRRREHATRRRTSAPSRGPTLVVGYDGSPGARAAVAAARRQAGDHGHVVVVHVTRPPASWLGRPYYDDAVAERVRAGGAVLGELADLGDDRMSLELLHGDPADVLLRVAAVRDADGIVIGARRLGRLRAALSSVSRAVLRAADRPVLVVRATPALA